VLDELAHQIAQMLLADHDEVIEALLPDRLHPPLHVGILVRGESRCFRRDRCMGIDATGVANVAMDKMGAAYAATGGKVSRMRKQRRAGETVSNAFTAEERGKMV
jgi:hypothetical protein